MSKSSQGGISLQFDLIEQVRLHPEIWDYNHEGYNNNQVLMQSYDQIAKELLLPNRLVQLKWRRLRHKHGVLTRQSQATKKPVRWRYYESLSFLNNNSKNPAGLKILSTHSLQKNSASLDIPVKETPCEIQVKEEPCEIPVQEETPIASNVWTETPSLNNGNGYTSDEDQKDKPDEATIKTYLRTLLAEVEPLTDKQMRFFKREVSELVETILD